MSRAMFTEEPLSRLVYNDGDRARVHFFEYSNKKEEVNDTYSASNSTERRS